MIYLDYNATTPIDPRVLDAMLPFLEEEYGNPSSGHLIGQRAKSAVERSRQSVAALLACDPGELMFTGSGSEANNVAIKGICYRAMATGDLRRGVVISAVEHPSVRKPAEFMARQGFTVTIVPVDRYGRVDMAAAERSVNDDTLLVSVMHANNEVGTIQPVVELSGLARKRGAFFHVDAAQSVGKIAVDVGKIGADLLTVVGHKIYAPKGVGALYVRKGVALEPLIHGAGHESGRRAGTENVASIVGLGKACKLAAAEVTAGRARLRALSDRFYEGIKGVFPSVSLNGHPEERLPNTLNVSFSGHSGASMLERLSGVAASTGAACHDRQVTISEVLSAMGVGEAAAMGSIRFSLGRFTTEAEVDETIVRLGEALAAAT